MCREFALSSKMIDYAPDETISEYHMLTPQDEPFLFVRALSVNYSAGSAEGMHTHSWAQFLWAQSGTIRAGVGGKQWLVPPARGLWIPADMPHSIVLSEKSMLRTLYVRDGAGGGLHDSPTPFAINVSPLLHELILRVCAIGYLDERVAVHKALGVVLGQEMAGAEQSDLALVIPTDKRGGRLAEMLLAPENQSVSLAALCARAGLGRRTAERVFVRETGMSPGQWRRLARLSSSLEMILAGMAIDDVAAHCGYRSRSAFGEAFKQLFGCAPKSFR